MGPNYRAGETDRKVLVSCYRRSLAIADELGAQRVAFPLISAGAYAFEGADDPATVTEVAHDGSTADPDNGEESACDQVHPGAPRLDRRPRVPHERGQVRRRLRRVRPDR